MSKIEMKTLVAARKKTRKVLIGNVPLGGGEPVRVQSMCTTDTRDVEKTTQQILAMEEVGCEIARVAVPDMEAAQKLSQIREQIHIPLVADIHFDWRLALEAVRQGIHKVRINPGNIGERKRTEEVVKACRAAGIPMRVGVNAGSLKILKEADRWTAMTPQEWADQMVQEALEQISILEEFGFGDIVVSLKADDLERVILAYRTFSAKYDYPLHVGLTEAGTMIPGAVKSSIALSTLLMEGIGDTIRCSLTEEPVLQVKVAYEILKALGLRSYGPDIIACPTCGRCEVDLFKIVRDFEKRLSEDPQLFKKAQGKKIAIMGCVVNGPGEAKDADFGVAGGKGVGIFIQNGKPTRNLNEADWVQALVDHIQRGDNHSDRSNKGKESN